MAATTAPAHGRDQDPRGSNLDVDWLLHGKRDFTSPAVKEPKDDNVKPRPEPQTAPLRQERVASPAPKQPAPEPTVAADTQSSQTVPQKPQPAYTHNNAAAPSSPSQPITTQSQSPRTPPEDSKKSGKSSKKDGRRQSWFSSLGHKISGGSSTSSRNASIDSMSGRPAQSPKLEFQNPFDKSSSQSSPQSPQQQKKPEVLTHHVPAGTRRPSVLVAAGTETKLDHPGFLTSALRRLSSGSAVTLGKGAGSTNAVAPRRVLNIDQHRERTKIPEFDQNKLRRVAFCVDVEIAGISSQADEDATGLEPIENLPTSKAPDSPGSKRSSLSAKYKEKGEGAALKDPENAKDSKEEIGQTQEDAEEEKKLERNEALAALEGATPDAGDDDDEKEIEVPSEKPMTRKKEKKKRSEAERKERRERKRRHAEMNGLVPLELTKDDDSDSSSCNTPAGASTPRNGAKPTTNPLRIYKRCCQLRETTALSIIKEQISRPAATLAESPGTVAVVDLSGSKMSLQDIDTLGDWLAVVPVRKLILDDCGLGDEAVRIILSGLLGCKTSEQARLNRKLPRRSSGQRGQEQLGVIEKLSLRHNTAITSLGWKHIALFIHLSRSLSAIDLTGVPYPKSAGDLSRSPTETSVSSAGTSGTTKKSSEMGTLVARAIHERFGTKLQELILSGCSLSSSNISELIDAAIHCRIRRLGLAGNHLSNEAMGHVVRYAVSDVCEGLDLGSNNLHDNEHLLSQMIHENNPMVALSLADCHLTPEDLQRILPKLCEMKTFKFLDLSRNYGLFEGEDNAVRLLRKYLPKMQALKRLHLVDSGLKPEHVIALSDVLPDCPALAHINLLENEPLVQVMNSSQVEHQEEAAAFLASLMTATRVSRTLVAVELEVPSSQSSEVVRALSQQVVAYSLRNMEKSALNDFGVDTQTMPDRDAPDVLLHLVGHMDGYKDNHDRDDPAPDEDYLIASTGLVKALSVCLGNSSASGNASRNMTPTASGAGTPRQGPLRPQKQKKKPKDVSRELCESARKIRMRLQPALVKEDRAGNQDAYRRLFFLDQTLGRIIQRFEDEYPDTRAVETDVTDLDITSPTDSPNLSRMSTAQDTNWRNGHIKLSPDLEPSALRYSPSSSSTSLASKALVEEEGRMLKFGQSMRRELLKPVGQDDHVHGTSTNDSPEPVHLAALRHKLVGMSGEEIRERVEREGADNVVRELEINAAELRMMADEDPVGFEALRNCSLMNEVRRMSKQLPSPINLNRRPRIPETFNEQVTT